MRQVEVCGLACRRVWACAHGTKAMQPQALSGQADLDNLFGILAVAVRASTSHPAVHGFQVPYRFSLRAPAPRK